MSAGNKQAGFRQVSVLAVITIAVALLLPMQAQSQAQSQSQSTSRLQFGNHPVGFRILDLSDYSRATARDSVTAEGEFDRVFAPRRLKVGVWYPAARASGARMRYGDYLRYFSLPLQPAGDSATAAKAILDWPNLWNRPAGMSLKIRRDSLRATIARASREPTHAVLNAPRDDGSYPVVIYTAGADGPAIENDVLAEYLASKGYVVYGIPCWSADGKSIRVAVDDAETVARDIEFVMGYARQSAAERDVSFGLVGWSWGGLASGVVASRNRSVAAVVGFDPSIRYRFDSVFVKAAPNSNTYSTPSLFLLDGKTSPDTIRSWGGETGFQFFDSLRYAKAYSITFLDLAHQNFSAMYNRLAGPQPNNFNSDPSAFEPGYAAIVRYTSAFFDAQLKKQVDSLSILEHAFPNVHVTIVKKDAIRPLPSAASFIASLHGDFAHASVLIDSVLKINPAYSVPQNDLLKIGSDFLDDDNRVKDAAGLFEAYTTLFPKDVRGWNNLGFARAEAHEIQSAIEAYRHALLLDPTNSFALDAIARLTHFSSRSASRPAASRRIH